MMERRDGRKEGKRVVREILRNIHSYVHVHDIAILPGLANMPS